MRGWPGRGGGNSDSGAAAVEFALVSLLLVVLVVGIIQFGYLFFQWLELTHAAREGARWAALWHEDGTIGTPGTTRYKVWESAPGLQPRLTDEDITIVPSSPSSDDTGDPVTVTVSHEVPIFTPFMQNLFGTEGDTFMLTSSATMRIE